MSLRTHFPFLLYDTTQLLSGCMPILKKVYIFKISLKVSEALSSKIAFKQRWNVQFPDPIFKERRHALYCSFHLMYWWNAELMVGSIEAMLYMKQRGCWGWQEDQHGRRSWEIMGGITSALDYISRPFGRERNGFAPCWSHYFTRISILTAKTCTFLSLCGSSFFTCHNDPHETLIENWSFFLKKTDKL